MKKLSLYVFLALLWCNVSFADGIKELNKKLLEIEKRLDTCLSTKDKDICNNFVLENPYMLEILGNADFAKLLTSNKYIKINIILFLKITLIKKEIYGEKF